jgi:threonylcarbamoyladenosine tRNA methylthiotransferase MtaB
VRVYYHTFGCKANQYDTERMRQESEARGTITTSIREETDVFVVNTCTVTSHADADARRFVRRLHREHPGASVVVAGCSASLREADYRSMPGVTEVVPGHDPVSVAASLRGAAPGLQRAREGARRGGQLAQIELRTALDRIDTEPIGGELLRRRVGASRGWLKVQDGCDRKCSFCATRLARGVSRSRPLDEVVAEARLLAEAHAELVVTGIHIGHYGIDLEPASTLSRLCAELIDRVPDVRFRLGSIEATEVDDLLVDLLANSGDRLAPHLHMPLQSGADAVLRLMRRWHTREQYRARAWEIAEKVQPLGLGADVITGFPGESTEDHASTRALIEELPFTYLHVFPFSPRADTVAAGLPGPVPQRVSGARARELREIARAKGSAHRAGRVGSAATVVLEGEGGTGLTEDYLRVDVTQSGVKGKRSGHLRSRSPVVRGTLLGDGDHLYIDAPHESPRIQA